ncbi:MAG TPA: TIGR03790 family protein [Kiritimatiellia bacterium]|nr:TIGR03790 family protein [Kiritimatiellia bacterium]
MTRTSSTGFLVTFVAVLCTVMSSLVVAQSIQELDAAQTVVVANRNVPGSVELARHYMSVREIPESHLCVLDLPTAETMSRWNYENKLRRPLQDFLRDLELIEQVRRDEASLDRYANPWRTLRSQVRYIVSMYGVPLKIAETRPFLLAKLDRLTGDSMQRDGAAVDSELACMLWDSYEIKGIISNPLYNYLVMARNQRGPRPILLAARLDGPDIETVRRMIDDAVEVETRGLLGRAYIDYRQVRDPDYYWGDHWLREAGSRLGRAGLEVVFDHHEAVFDASFPMEDAAIYFGWYREHVAGPFTNRGFRFRPGAVAYHLHSFSARTLRTSSHYWAGPLLSAGAVATMGAVEEPYLSFTPDLAIFADRLAAGYSFGESAYLSQRVLSWQITVVGDPLYRPFKWNLDEQVARLGEAGHPDAPWAHVVRMNRMLDQHQFNPVLAYGRELLRRDDNMIIREKLADLYARNELWNEAIREYQWIVNHSATDLTAVRVGHRLLLVSRAMKRTEEADKIEAAIRERWPDSPYLPHLEGAIP